MSSEGVDSESTVSGNQANIPARIRRELDIDDGDTLRWELTDDGTVRVRVVKQRNGTFRDFDGYGGDVETDAAAEHDEWGVDESRRLSSANQNAKRSGDVDIE